MDTRFSLRELLDELDGYGLVITDYDLIEECLDNLGIDGSVPIDYKAEEYNQ